VVVVVVVVVVVDVDDADGTVSADRAVVAVVVLVGTDVATVVTVVSGVGSPEVQAEASRISPRSRVDRIPAAYRLVRDSVGVDVERRASAHHVSIAVGTVDSPHRRPVFVGA